jgi:RimJ/RimL family protein N-acetyltransferase
LLLKYVSKISLIYQLLNMNFSENIILENKLVLLRPLKSDDENSLAKIAFDTDVWKYTVTSASNSTELKEYINTALKERKRNIRYPFTIVKKNSGEIAGSTSYGNISDKDKRLEIGWTWIGKKFMGTGLNKNCKFLLLEYAFEHLMFERVEFKTDLLNKAARRALEKIGAKEEGVLRSHTLMHDGRRRDTIYYSILKDEWEKLKNSFLY